MDKIFLYDLKRRLKHEQHAALMIDYLREHIHLYTREELSELLGEVLEYCDNFRETADFLITEGNADISFKRYNALPIIFRAIGENRPAAVRYAPSKGASLHIGSPEYLLPIAYIFKHNKLAAIAEMIQLLQEHQISFNFVLPGGNTPLTLAVRYNYHPETIQFLLDQQVDKYVYNEDGFTAIHYVPFGNAPDLHLLMLDSAADIQVKAQFTTSMEPVFECVIKTDADATFEDFVHEALNTFLDQRHNMYGEVFERFYSRLLVIAEHVEALHDRFGI